MKWTPKVGQPIERGSFLYGKTYKRTKNRNIS